MVVFRSREDARSYAAETDLPARGHVGIFELDGTALALRVNDRGELELAETDSVRLSALEARLAEYQRVLNVLPEKVEPAAVAERWLAAHER